MRHLFGLFILLILLSYSPDWDAQIFTRIDSLRLELKKHPKPGERIHILNEIAGFLIVEGKYSEAERILIRSIKLAESRNNHKELAIACNLYGIIQRNINEPENAIRMFDRALKEAEGIGDSTQMAHVLSNLGLVQSDLSHYDEAIQYYLKAWKIRDGLDDLQGAVKSATSVGNIYYYQKNEQKALNYYLSALKIAERGNMKYEKGILLSNVAMIYLDQGKNELSMRYFKLSLKTTREIGDEEGTADALLGIGEVLLNQQQFQEALEQANRSLEIYRQFGNKRRQAETYELMGKVYTAQKKWDKARESFEMQMTIANKINSLENTRSAYKNLADQYRKQGKYKEAYDWFVRYTDLKDSLLSEERMQMIADREAQFQMERRKRENQLLAQKNQTLQQQNRVQELSINRNRVLVVGLVLLVLSVLVIGMLAIRYRSSKAERERVEVEQKLLRSQMNPHFIFNAMVGIQNYIYREEPEIAANYLSSVVALMRSIMEHATRELVPLEDEINALHHYLRLQQIRYHQKFAFEVVIDPELETDLLFIPPMMAQPVIENAIEHGILHKTTDDGVIRVEVKAGEEGLMLIVEDNGIGREKARELNVDTEKHLSVATRITQERISIMNRKYRKKSRMEIEDLHNPEGKACGTRVTFYFPENFKKPNT